MPRQSAGLLMYRTHPRLEVFLVHPGGPFFRHKDEGAWTIPKGLLEKNDMDALETAKREFEEETGFRIPPDAHFTELGRIQQKGGKYVWGWAFPAPGNLPGAIHSNTFDMEWPPRSGQTRSFPEADRGAFFEAGVARSKINPAQVDFIERLREKLDLDSK